MAFSRYNKDRPFLLITRHASPPAGVKTEQKNWHKESGWQIQESISIVDKVEDKHLLECTVILDIFKRSLVKNRFEEQGEEEVIKHYLKEYNGEIAEGIELWTRGHTEEREDAEALIKDIEDELHQIEVEIKP